MDKNIKSFLLAHTESKEILSEEVIQTLWSGYGSLIRVKLDNSSIIIKRIKFPTELDHPKVLNSNLSHQRKVKSYQVEINWYKNYNEELKEAYYPDLILTAEFEKTKYLVLEDLKIKGFIPKESISFKEIKLCIKWLAIFHAKNLNRDASDLWDKGTYWHLETRPDELNALTDLKLKKIAPLLDSKLNSAKYQTIVHGDAKLANFLFSEDKVSSVDFQYVGKGVGLKDLFYFLTSIYNEEDLFKNESTLLDYYFEELEQAISSYHSTINFKELENEWRLLFPVAACDFYRFLKGWSPNHYKLNSYSDHIIQKVLNVFN